MKKFIISLLIGIGAGVVDVIPMIAQKLDIYSDISAFSHWVILAVLIAYIQWDAKGWIKGLVLAEVTAIPVLVLVYKEMPVGIIPIIIMSAILGCAVGFLTEKYAQ